MSALLLAVDDGITTGNLNAADWSFLIGLIAAGLAAIAYATPATPATTTEAPHRPLTRWAPVLVAVAVALVALGLLLLQAPAVDWASLSHAGAAIAGLALGVIITLRAAKLVAGVLSEVRRRERDELEDGER